MGVSKQAAQKRFVPRAAPVPGSVSEAGLANAVTARTRSVITAAEDEARTLGDSRVRPEHLVLGLLSEPNALAMRALADQGVSADAMRAAATSALPSVPGPSPDPIDYDAATQKVLQLSFREALRLGHNYIGTEHLLLALLEQEAGSGVLSGLGATKERSEQWLAAALARVAGR